MKELAESSTRSDRRRGERARPRLLVVDDQADVCDLLRLVLEQQGYDVTTEATGEDALQRLTRHAYDLVLSDVVMPGTDGITLCRELGQLRPELPIVLFTARLDTAMVVQALRVGARDFLTKPLEMDALLAAIARLLAEPPASHRFRRTHERTAKPGCDVAGLIGESEAMRRVRALILELADSTASVIVQGETGTGKENVARALHATSGAPSRPFVALNCAALPANLLESELFGHAKGAFSDATAAKKGLLLAAGGGTLFLDEVSELPLAMQPKLLRAIQERVVRPLGQNRELPFDCRLIAAANQDLELAVLARRFRDDLYYRLDVVRIALPPLRERGDDALLLAEHFLAHFAAGSSRWLTLTEAVRDVLLAYEWPGNVRELENCMEHALALSQGDTLRVEDLPIKVRHGGRRGAQLALPMLDRGAREPSSLYDAERNHVLRTLSEVGQNKTRAASLLGIDRRTLHRRLRRYRAGSPHATPGVGAAAPGSARSRTEGASSKATDWGTVEGRWQQLTDRIKAQWSRLTDDDIVGIAGRRTLLVGKLRERYGAPRADVEKQVDDWLRNIAPLLEHERRR